MDTNTEKIELDEEFEDCVGYRGDGANDPENLVNIKDKTRSESNGKNTYHR